MVPYTAWRAESANVSGSRAATAHLFAHSLAVAQLIPFFISPSPLSRGCQREYDPVK